MRLGVPRGLGEALAGARRVALRCTLAFLVGCHSAAHPYLNDHPTNAPLSRTAVLTQQVVDDSARAMTERPLTSGWELLHETGDHLGALADGGLAKRLLHLYESPAPLQPAAPPADNPDLEAALRDLTDCELEPARLRYLFDGAAALGGLFDLIDNAEQRIDVLMFFWDDDDLGQAIAARLAARAGPGLRVRVLIDGGGNLVFGETHPCAAKANRVLAVLATNPYIEVIRIRNPFLRFDHRKLVLVDGRWAWSGGRNFTRDAFFDHHDLSFVLDGPLVPRLQNIFDAHWLRQHGTPAAPLAPLAAPPHDPCRDVPSSPARVVVSEPGRRELAQALYLAIDHAKHRVYLQNVYFSDSRLVVKLAEARRRGVDVRVVLTFTSESGTVNRANRVLAARLLRAGIRVFVYPGMTHVKAALVDGAWAYVGTGNFDALSLRHNYEVGLSLGPGPAVAELERRLFEADFQPEWELTQPPPLTFQDYWSEWVASLFL